MDLLTDILTVLARQWVLVLSMAALVFFATAVIAIVLRTVTEDHFTDIEYFSLALPGWLIPVFLWALLARLFLFFLDFTFAAFVIATCMFVPLLRKKMGGKRKKISPFAALLFVMLLFSAAIHMAFISRMTFPAYFDSAEHYRLIKFLVENPSFPLGQSPTPSYYHIGYHLILAALVQSTNTGMINAMLVSGQWALAIPALSLFFITTRETDSQPTAFFTMLLAGFGWYMPGHAINWGKYPAIFGMICIIFVMNLVYIILQKKTGWISSKKLLSILFCALVISTIIHTRSLVICGLFATALIAANHWEGLERRLRSPILGAFIFILIACGVYLRTDSTFITLFSSYGQEDFVMLMFLLLLIPFSIWKFPKFTLVLFLFISLMFISLYIPLYGLFGYSNLFLLDRPYVQMLLYLPFSLLGGLGFAGAMEAAAGQMIASIPLRLVVQGAAFGILAINAVLYQSYYPSDCCQLAGRDDAAALSWIEQELPRRATVLIASQDLSFTPNADLLSTTGMDAGIWVTPLTARETVLFSSNTDFSQPEALQEICILHVEYIYVGNKAESFWESGLTIKPEWYQVVFILPQVKIYQVTGCS